MIRKHFLAVALLISSVAAFAAQVCVPDPARPAGNTGTGFYVAPDKGGQWRLYDAHADEFRIRGVNHNHWDQSGAYAGIPMTGANAVRIVMPGTLKGSTGNADAAYTVGMVNKFLAAGLVPILGDWRGTCSADPADYARALASWEAARPLFAQFDSTVMLNIANEWGGTAGTSPYSVTLKKSIYVPNYTWRDTNIAGVKRMRAAGYLNTLVIDAGNCGQDATLVARDGPAILAADPQKNVLFDVHVYGGFHKPSTASWMQDYDAAMMQLQVSKLPLILGEFGPGRNIGPSPTMVTPETIIATAEANGWGWLSWAYGDNNMAGCMADEAGFSMTVKCGTYTGSPGELTSFGRILVPLLKSYNHR